MHVLPGPSRGFFAVGIIGCGGEAVNAPQVEVPSTNRRCALFAAKGKHLPRKSGRIRNKNNDVRGVRELPDPPRPSSGKVEVCIHAASNEPEQATGLSAAWEHGAGPLWGMGCRPHLRWVRPQWCRKATSPARAA